jgi:hypothetical protein
MLYMITRSAMWVNGYGVCCICRSAPNIATKAARIRSKPLRLDAAQLPENLGTVPDLQLVHRGFIAACQGALLPIIPRDRY